MTNFMGQSAAFKKKYFFKKKLKTQTKTVSLSEGDRQMCFHFVNVVEQEII